MFTTNVEFSRWGTVFADDKLAAAIVDRVVHHGRLMWQHLLEQIYERIRPASLNSTGLM